MDCIARCETVSELAIECNQETLDKHFSTAFGIFAGAADQVAKLHFNEVRARWVEKEQWHPDQQGEWVDGSYILTLPYHNPTELIMDILKYGPDVEVLAPQSLREAVIVRLRETLDGYGVDTTN